MFWFGFAAQEQAISIASSNGEQAQTQATGESPQRYHDGSVDDHHLDHQPVQVQVQVLAQAEGAMDLPGLFARPDALPSAFTEAWPRPRAVDTRLAPYLDGPRRPPRATRLLA